MKKYSVFLLLTVFAVLAALLCSCSYTLSADGFELVSDFVWDGAHDFSEGMAAVKKDGKWGFIDLSGNLVIANKYDSAGSFSEGLCAVQTGYAWNYIDKTGKTVIHGDFEAANAFSEGRASVMINNKYALIDKDGNLLTNPVFDIIRPFRGGAAAAQAGNTYSFIKADGTVLGDFKWGGASDFSEGVAEVFEDYLSGYIDIKGEFVIPLSIDDGSDFSEGLCAAMTKERLWGYIDKSGSFVIDAKWKEAEDFSEGFAVVGTGTRYAYVSAEGKEITPFDFNRAYAFSCGRARVGVASGVGLSFGFISPSGEYAVSPSYPGAHDYSEGYAAVKNASEKWGYIDTDGNTVIPFDFDDAYSFRDGVARVVRGKKYGFILISGTEG
jgi:hypothetical protein